MKHKTSILKLIESDLIQARIWKGEKDLSLLRFLFFFIKSKTCRIHAFVRFRRSNKLLALIAKLYLNRFLIEIGSRTIIGSHFFMPHPRCIIIANDIIIGNHVHVGQYVTLGGNFKKTKTREDGSVQKLPIIGNNVNILPGAVIGGPVTVSNDVIIGANSVTTHDVPSNSIVYGQNQRANKKIILPPSGGSFEIMKE